MRDAGPFSIQVPLHPAHAESSNCWLGATRRYQTEVCLSARLPHYVILAPLSSIGSNPVRAVNSGNSGYDAYLDLRAIWTLYCALITREINIPCSEFSQTPWPCFQFSLQTQQFVTLPVIFWQPMKSSVPGGLRTKARVYKQRGKRGKFQNSSRRNIVLLTDWKLKSWMGYYKRNSIFPIGIWWGTNVDVIDMDSGGLEGLLLRLEILSRRNW